MIYYSSHFQETRNTTKPRLVACSESSEHKDIMYLPLLRNKAVRTWEGPLEQLLWENPAAAATVNLNDPDVRNEEGTDTKSALSSSKSFKFGTPGTKNVSMIVLNMIVLTIYLFYLCEKLDLSNKL